MANAIFLLIKDPDNPCRDLICHRDSSLRIRVFCLDEEKFEPDAEELQFYALDHGSLLAFETFGFNRDEPGLVIEAIRWYARYIKNPTMEILAEDPRYEQEE